MTARRALYQVRRRRRCREGREMFLAVFLLRRAVLGRQPPWHETRTSPSAVCRARESSAVSVRNRERVRYSAARQRAARWGQVFGRA